MYSCTKKTIFRYSQSFSSKKDVETEKDGFIVPLANFMQTPLYVVRNYHVEIVANSEDQVKDTFKVAYDMLYENAKFKGKFSVTRS